MKGKHFLKDIKELAEKHGKSPQASSDDEWHSQSGKRLYDTSCPGSLPASVPKRLSLSCVGGGGQETDRLWTYAKHRGFAEILSNSQSYWRAPTSGTKTELKITLVIAKDRACEIFPVFSLTAERDENHT